MTIQLSDHFTYRKLFLFTIPSVVMMIFTSIYSVVDGFFISNFVGITEFSAINLIFPFTQMLGCIGFMFGAGGSALVSKTLGMGDRDKANRVFSMLTYLALVVGALLAVLGLLTIRPIAVWMGADQEMLPFCVQYGSILLITLPAFMLQNMFQSFLVAAEKPTLGLLVTVAAGLTNMALDALFIIGFDGGIVGAAVATGMSQCVGGVIPFVYFLRKNSSLLQLGKTHMDGKALLDSCTNGSSEFVSNISMSLVSILYNSRLMKLVGGDGVAAYGAVMYVGFIFAAVFLGYAIGVAPVISFHYGAGDTRELKSLCKKSNLITILTGMVLAVIAFVLAEPIAKFFLGSDAVANNPALIQMTVRAFRFYAVGVLFSGFSIFGSSFFTALNDGGVSAAISFLRTLVFQMAAVLILPLFFDVDGIWASLFVAEVAAMLVTVVFYLTKQKKYQY